MEPILQYSTGLCYTAEKNKLILISLLKQYGISNVVVSPGATNVTFVASLQYDNYFHLYSCVDERAAAYMALGIALETKQPVVLSCTGATSSRNYFPGLSEAYYRNIPILVVTSSLSSEFVGHDYPQVTDREHAPFDIVKKTYVLQNIKDNNDYWDCTIKANRALNSLLAVENGPVHINLETIYSSDFSIKKLPEARVIRVFQDTRNLPNLEGSNIAVFIGSHKKLSKSLQDEIELFCEKHNSLVLCDLTSNYHGKYKVNASLLYVQEQYTSILRFDKIIYLGDITGDYYTAKALFDGELWRVSEDGEIKDRFRNTKYVFEMCDKAFFAYYNKYGKKKEMTLHAKVLEELNHVQCRIPELPFSNIWIAQHTSSKIPMGSSIHLGILNSLRSWNFFDLPDGTTSFCNVGGFGIDGCMSSLIGAAQTDPTKLFFGVFGDLSFFYDMNVLRSECIFSNVRIIIVNNGRGTEFRNYNHPAAVMGKAVDPYVAAAGHFGYQSRTTIQQYSESCGFEYLSASTKEEYLVKLSSFISTAPKEKPVLFEVFTDSDDESDALKAISNIIDGGNKIYSKKVKSFIKKLLKR